LTFSVARGKAISASTHPDVVPVLATLRAFAQASGMRRSINGRRAVTVRVGIAGAALACAAACNDELVENVSPEVCASGKRWVGDVTGSEEMYPGQDCVSCHRAVDGPAFFAAGTVYGLPDPEGARTTGPLCFGVPDARVTITGADGVVFQTHTNRAGNFYFEGRDDALAKPFSVEVDYTRSDGRASRQSMATLPSYGGCAHCHDPNPGLPFTPDAGPGGVHAPADRIEGVYPIYTGPVYE
jgi:hypothetical protein